MTILITRAVGFIGFHVTQRLLAAGREVVGFDGMTSDYDISLERARLARLTETTAKINVFEGVRRFVAWNSEYCGEGR